MATRKAKAKTPVTPGLVAKALAALPERIHVGATPIKIKIMTPSSKDRHVVWGQFDPHDHVLWLNPEFPSLTFMGMIFTHELFHAIWWAQGLTEDPEPEERVVSLMSAGLTQVYRDNPWVLPWIAETLRFDRAPPRLAETTKRVAARAAAAVKRPRKKAPIGFVTAK